MKKTALSLLVAIMASVAAVSSAWAFDCPNLYAKCRDALQKSPNNEAAKLCEEGIQLHKQGKHEEAVARLTQGLQKLGVVKSEKKM